MTQAPAAVRARHEIPAEHTWNAPSVFASDEVWQTEYRQLSEQVPTLKKLQGTLGTNPAALGDAIDAIQAFRERVEKVYVYASMHANADTADQSAVAMEGQARSLYGQFLASIGFIDPELLQIGEKTLREWITQEPPLTILAHYVDNLFRLQQHVRSAEVEEILGLAADPFSSVSATARTLTNADLVFKPVVSKTGDTIPVMQSNINTLLFSPDRETRRTAWENYADGYLSVKNTLANNLTTAIKQDVFNARVRRYGSALESALFPNNIPVEVFHNLVNTCRSHVSIWHRYWAVRRRLLGYDTLHEYDIWAPLTANEPVVPYTRAVDWISEGMKPLGEEYVRVLRRGSLEERWVDIYPNQGKRAGAFSSGTKGTHPFIMMSYGDNLKAMSTLAHELGHSMHSYFTWQNQPGLYSDYSIFVAEVASNFNQALVRAHLLNTNPDPEFQVAVIDEAMTNFHRYFFIMPTLASFELETHQRIERGAALTADSMNALMAELFAEGYGSELHFDPERTGITWAQFGHLYANFYVFQYATGISGAHALAQRVLSGEPHAADDYLSFLKAGSSMYPLDALKRAGVDLTTSEAVEKTFAVLNDMVSRLETIATANP